MLVEVLKRPISFRIVKASVSSFSLGLVISLSMRFVFADVVLYVTHYICKDESQALKQVIAERLASHQQDATVKQRLRKIGNTLLSHCQLSQQEAAFLVAGLHPVQLSSSQLFLSANELDWSGHHTSCENLITETQMSSCMGYL